jgi:Flp pilus assembly protein TadD
VSDARALYRDGFQHFVQGRLDEAVACYRKAVAADPQLAIAWNGLSMALQRSGQLEAAIDAARRLVELEPDDPLSHTNLSILYQQQGRIQEAEDEMALATRLGSRQEGS